MCHTILHTEATHRLRVFKFLKPCDLPVDHAAMLFYNILLSCMTPVSHVVFGSKILHFLFVKTIARCASTGSGGLQETIKHSLLTVTNIYI